MQKDYFESFNGKTVGFVGIGISNRPILETLAASGVPCIVRDRKNLLEEGGSGIAELIAKGVRFICGDGYLDQITEDVLFLSPAVRPDLPPLQQAEKTGTRITSELQEFFAHCPCRIIGITGSDGKTTTTTLIARILEEDGKRVHLGGNIGSNLLVRLPDIRPEDYAVVELSSFQLMKMSLSPDIAVITNLAPNHLDWHVSMEEYAEAKSHILMFQKSGSIAVLNRDDPYADMYAAKAKGTVRFLSGTRPLTDGVWFDQTGIYRKKDLLVSDSGILLVGRHNRYNYCAAAAALEGIVSDESIRRVAATFAGVEHRIELVRVLRGISFYNSSIDSSPSRTTACLNSFQNKVIVICGGYDKHIPLDSLGPLFVEKVKYAAVCGATAPKLQSVFDASGFGSYGIFDDFEEAVLSAYRAASPGDCVVLSPAAASFDRFRNFEERGNTFKSIVNSLAE